METVKTLDTRSYRTAEHIRDRVPFKTRGAFKATAESGLTRWQSGWLGGEDYDRYNKDCHQIDYVVWSYDTPIAWHTTEGVWYKVKQKFSATTSVRHQSKLYLIDSE